jgi:hypothetical protein
MEIKRVFVCSPYHKSEDAINYCGMEYELGNAFFSPVLQYAALMDEWEAVQLALEHMDGCECHVWGEITEGMQQIIDYAEENGIPVVYMTR